jgi:hypothetical protein
MVVSIKLDRAMACFATTPTERFFLARPRTGEEIVSQPSARPAYDAAEFARRLRRRSA